jgi:hypothetical protein
MSTDMQVEDRVESLDEVKVSSLTLVSRTGDTFVIDRRCAVLSGLIKTTVEEVKDSDEIPLDVSTPVLKLFVDYLNHHQGVAAEIPEKPLKSKDIKQIVKDPWDAEFVTPLLVPNPTYDLLFEAIRAANYLSIVPLLHLLAAAIASKIKGVTTDKLKHVFQPITGTEDTPMSSSC